jgi:hypothetical protein
MILQAFRRITKSDYAAQFQDLVDQLSVSINNGFESLYQLTNNNISLKDNISCTLKTINLSVDDTGTPKTNTSISLSQTTAVQGLVILKIDNKSTASNYTTSGVNISYNITNTGVQVTNIKGLNPNDNYQIKVVIFQD